VHRFKLTGGVSRYTFAKTDQAPSIRQPPIGMQEQKGHQDRPSKEDLASGIWTDAWMQGVHHCGDFCNAS